jgi:hypothetical protein
MFQIGRSWELIKASWHVLLSDKELAIFPILSTICTVIAVAVFVLPVAALVFLADQATRGSRQISEPLGIALLFVFYLVTAFVTLFFNTALVGAVLERLRGGDPSVGTGFGVALRRLPAIFVYALVTATVGLALRLLENIGDGDNVVGQIASSLLGAGWSIVTFLVVPIMVAEDVSPFAAIGRSKDLLGRTWGQQIVGNLGLGLIFFLLALLGLLPLALGFLSHQAALIVAGLGLAVIYWVVLWTVATALGQIFRAAVYVFASTEQVPAQFDAGLLQNAFRAR